MKKKFFEIIKKSRANFIAVVILGIIFVILFIYLLKLVLFIDNFNYLIIIGIGLAVLLFVIFLKYLESDKSNRIVDSTSERILDEMNELIRRQTLSNTSRNSFQYKELIEELKTLKDKINDIQTKNLELNEDDKTKLFELFETKLEKNLSKVFLETIQQKFGTDILASERYSELQRDLIEIKERLRLEIRKLSLRANINLAIGSVTTLFAVIVLINTVVSKDTEFKDSVKMMTYFIPRISLAIFIEVFAFFFLKMYKSNLDNIKYYHNEMTNIESRIISLKSSILYADESTINEVIKELSKTERNFVIKKGETTIELESLRSEKKEFKILFETLKEIITKLADK